LDTYCGAKIREFESNESRIYTLLGRRLLLESIYSSLRERVIRYDVCNCVAVW